MSVKTAPRRIPGPAGQGSFSRTDAPAPSGETPLSVAIVAFQSRAWDLMCRAVGIDKVLRAGLSDASDEEWVEMMRNSVKKVIKSSLVDIETCKTLHLPILAVYVKAIIQNHNDQAILHVIDPSCLKGMYAFVSPETAMLHESIKKTGTVLLLENVAIFVCKESSCNYLNLHVSCISAVFT